MQNYKLEFPQRDRFEFRRLTDLKFTSKIYSDLSGKFYSCFDVLFPLRKKWIRIDSYPFSRF